MERWKTWSEQKPLRSDRAGTCRIFHEMFSIWSFSRDNGEDLSCHGTITRLEGARARAHLEGFWGMCGLGFGSGRGEYMVLRGIFKIKWQNNL